VLVALFPVAYYAVLGSGYTVFTRHMTPVVPFLCLTAGYFVAECAAAFARVLGRPRWQPAILILGCLVTLAPSMYSVMMFNTLLARTDSRVLARRWLEQRLPPGSVIAQFGPAGGHVYLSEESNLKYTLIDDVPSGARPEVVVVQSSPVTGTPDLGPFAPALRDHYRLAYSRRVARDEPRNIYDLQDEFYLPLAGFRVERPGPNLDIYVRNDVASEPRSSIGRD
jgi:hypothetical protein